MRLTAQIIPGELLVAFDGDLEGFADDLVEIIAGDFPGTGAAGPDVCFGDDVPGGQVFSFALPKARLAAEIQIGEHQREFELHPRTLTLYPDQGRFTIVFRGGRKYQYAGDEHRAVRMRASRGWVPAPGPELKAVTDS